MILTFLGTSSMVPTKERNVTGISLEYKGEVILFDCGEGTQRQMNICGINRQRVTKILITHWHGDHVGGLIGLIQTMSQAFHQDPDRSPITIVGPKGTKERMDHLLKMTYFDNKINLKILEIDPKGVETVLETQDYEIKAGYVEHSVPTLAYSFTEKERRRVLMAKLAQKGVRPGPHISKLQQGKDLEYKGKTYSAKDWTVIVPQKKLALVLDTVPCKNATELAKDADVLITEASFTTQHEHKAEEFKHMTAKWAAQLANHAGAKKLYLTHFSQRYKNSLDAQEEANQYFDNVFCAEDFMRIKM